MIAGGFFRFVIVIVLCCACDVASATQMQNSWNVKELAHQIKYINFLDKKIQQLGDSVTDDEIVAAYQKLKPDLKLEGQLLVPNKAHKPEKILLLARMIDKDVDNEYMWNRTQQQIFIDKLPEKRSGVAQYMLQFVCALTGNTSQQYAQQEVRRAIFVCSGHSVNGENTAVRHVVSFNQLHQSQEQRSVFCVLNEEPCLDYCGKLISSLIMQIMSENISNDCISDAKIAIESTTNQLVIYAILKPIEMNDILGNSLFYNKNVGYFTMFFKSQEALSQPYITDSIKIPLAVEECNGIKRLCMKTCYPAQIEQKFRCMQQLSQPQIQVLPKLFTARLSQSSTIQHLVTIPTNSVQIFDQFINQIVQKVKAEVSSFIKEFSQLDSTVSAQFQQCEALNLQLNKFNQVKLPTSKYNNKEEFIQGLAAIKQSTQSLQIVEQEVGVIKQLIRQEPNHEQVVQTLLTKLNDTEALIKDLFVNSGQPIMTQFVQTEFEQCQKITTQLQVMPAHIENLNQLVLKLQQKVQLLGNTMSRNLKLMTEEEAKISKVEALNQEIVDYNKGTGLQQFEKLSDLCVHSCNLAVRVADAYGQEILLAENLKGQLNMQMNAQQKEALAQEFNIMSNQIQLNYEARIPIVKTITYNDQLIQQLKTNLENSEQILKNKFRLQIRPKMLEIQLIPVNNYEQKANVVLGELNKTVIQMNQKFEQVTRLMKDITVALKK